MTTSAPPVATPSTHTQPLDWLDSMLRPCGALPVSDADGTAYPEVTGYTVPVWLRHGRNAQAAKALGWLLRSQLRDGGFAAPGGHESIAFDTGQVIRGLVAALQHDLQVPGYSRNVLEASAVAACRWLAHQVKSDGRLPAPSGSAWDMGPRGRIPEAVHLYVFPALAAAGRLLGEARWVELAQRGRDHYLRQAAENPAVIAFGGDAMLSHFFGYIHEAFCELGAEEVAEAALQDLAPQLLADRAVPAFAGEPWVCLTGMAQVGIVHHRLGQSERARECLELVLKRGVGSGRLPGSVGPGAAYFPDASVTWTAKFTQDLMDRVQGQAAGPDRADKPLDRNLEPESWHDSITDGQRPGDVIARVSADEAPRWVRPVLAGSAPGEHLLELGSGTGELSAHLAREGRRVTLLDFSGECLEFSRRVFAGLELPTEATGFCQADVLGALPFADDTFDLVWSSGLLEHFEPTGIDHIIRESARVSRGRVLALVPNAKSMAYRIGKAAQERQGLWTWGKEEPFVSLREQFAAAGLVDIEEYTIAADHAVKFLEVPGLEGLQQAFMEFLAGLPEAEREALDQGYLLVSVGRVANSDGAHEPASRSAQSVALGTLAVVPNDPLQAYEDGGYPDLTGYFNPEGAFDTVYCLSPHERERRTRYGMEVIPTTGEELAGRMRELGVDVLRAYCLPSATWAEAHRAPEVPFLVSVHDRDPGRCPGPLPVPDRFLSMSDAVTSMLVDKGADAGRISKLPNRVDLSVFTPTPDPEAEAAFRKRFPATHRILHVGRKSREKNLDGVIRSMVELGPGYCAVFAGPGDPASYEQLAAELGVADRCHFIGAVPNHELAAWYRAADCMCTPSRHEGFGIVFIEALASGGVVVTTDQAPLNQLVLDGQTGLLVSDPEDPTAIADQIHRACTDGELAARLRNAAPGSVERFRKEVIDAQEADIYRQWGGAPAVQVSRPAPRLPVDTSSIRLHLRKDEHDAVWDSVAAASPDAWFFHTAAAQRLLLQGLPFQDLSFLLEWEGRIVGICPLGRVDHFPRTLKSGAMGHGGPALLPGLAPEERAFLQRQMYGILDRFLLEGVGDDLELLIPTLSRSAHQSRGQQVNPLVAHGYRGAVGQSAVLDLRSDEQALMRGMRHGHRQEVNRARRLDLEIRPMATQQDLEAYYLLHCETYHRTGVPPHPKSYFQAIFDHVVMTGRNRVFMAFRDGEALGATNLAVHGDSAMYWTGAYAAEALKTGAGKLLMWEAIQWCKQQGLHWLEVGEVFPSAAKGTKEWGLTRYKGGFSDATVPVWRGFRSVTEIGSGEGV